MLEALRDEEGSARFVRTVMQILRVDTFWAFCVDLERSAVAWEARTLESPDAADPAAFGVHISHTRCAAPDWMLKLAAASSDRAVFQAVHVDSAAPGAPCGIPAAWAVRRVDNDRLICVSSEGEASQPPTRGNICALGDAAILLEEAFTLRARMRFDRQQTMGFAAMAEASTFGVALLDENAGIHFVNNAARAILDAGDGLTNKSGKLAALRTGENRLLEALLREGSAGATNVIQIERRSGAKSYGVLHVAAVTSATGDRSHAILINDPDEPLAVSAARVQQLFGLTTAESMIAARCAAGVEPRDLAQELGISRLTLRTHLRSIFRKTGVKRQVELVILLLRSVAAAVADRT